MSLIRTVSSICKNEEFAMKNVLRPAEFHDFRSELHPLSMSRASVCKQTEFSNNPRSFLNGREFTQTTTRFVPRCSLH